MSGHPTVRDDPDDVMVRRAATTGHRMAMGPGEPALTEWAAAGLALPDGARLMWREIDGVGYEDGMLDDVLTLTLTLTLQEKGAVGRKSAKVKLPGIKAQCDLLKAALGQYRERHKVAYRLGR